MKIIIISLFVAIISLSCNSTDPEAKEESRLTVADVSCTEVWLELKAGNIALPSTGVIRIDGTKDKPVTISGKNTVLYIDSLEVNRNYKFQVILLNQGQTLISNEATAKTLDTTSHNFTWQTFEFGQHSSSALYDVAIIDENNIWAVGEIYMKDSLGNPDPKRYNAVHWDGNNWELKRIKTNACGGVDYPPIKTLLAFSSSDILFAHIDGSITKYNGIQFTNDCTLITQLNGSANKMWGKSNNNFYVVSGNGFIAHWNGSSWAKIESETSLGLSDVYGNENGLMYVCGGDLSTGQGIVLKINSNNTVTKIIDGYYYGTGFDSTKMFSANLYGPITSIWVNSSGTLYSVGNLIYRYNLSLWGYAIGIEFNDLNSGPFSGRGFSWGIRGNENNDFIFVGEKNTIRHFNGVSTIQLGETFSYSSEYRWYSVDYKQNTAAAVGRKGGYSAIIVIKK